MLRFEAIVHNTTQLRCGRTLEKSGEITTRLAGMVDGFTSVLDCIDVGFLPEGILDRLPLPQLRGKGLVTKPGRTRRYHVPEDAARTIAALLAVRDPVIAPILAGVRIPRLGRPPTTLTPIARTTRNAAPTC